MDVIRFAALEPEWTTSRATEPGFFRWIVRYPAAGHVAGIMGIPAGNRQHGFHTHAVAEIYVVLRGILRSVGPGTEHVAGPLDCIVIPSGVAHGVEAVGTDDALFLWYHDAQEAPESAVYYDELADAPRTEARIRVVRHADLAEERKDRPGGFVHSRRTWLDERLSLRSLEVAPASRSGGLTGLVVVVAGEARVRGELLGFLDAAVLENEPVGAGALGAAQLAVAR